MLSDFILKHKTFLLQLETATWQDAVKKSVDLLIDSGCASPAYYEAILNAVKEFGPYFVIAPGIALPHARPEQGSLKPGYALVCLKNPVCFGHSTNDPVDIILCLTAPDKQTLHEQVITEAMNLFDNDKALSDLRNAKNEKHLEKILRSINTEDHR